MAKDWVPCFGYGVGALVAVPIGPPTQFVIPLVGTGLGVDPAGNQVGVPDTDPESVTVHRHIGQFNFRLLSVLGEPSEVRVGLRFTTALFNQTLGALFPFTLDLNSGADANEGFISERRFTLSTPEVDSTDVFVDPKWSHFDLPSKRTLRSAEWTCVVVTLQVAQAQQPDAVIELQHWLRAWVTTSG